MIIVTGRHFSGSTMVIRILMKMGFNVKYREGGWAYEMYPISTDSVIGGDFDAIKLVGMRHDEKKWIDYYPDLKMIIMDRQTPLQPKPGIIRSEWYNLNHIDQLEKQKVKNKWLKTLTKNYIVFDYDRSLTHPLEEVQKIADLVGVKYTWELQDWILKFIKPGGAHR